jgi:hypothetical protein
MILNETFNLFYNYFLFFSDIKVDESNLELKLAANYNEENNNEPKKDCLVFKFEDFKLETVSFRNLKRNSPVPNQVYFESIFR